MPSCPEDPSEDVVAGWRRILTPLTPPLEQALRQDACPLWSKHLSCAWDHLTSPSHSQTYAGFTEEKTEKHRPKGHIFQKWWAGTRIQLAPWPHRAAWSFLEKPHSAILVSRSGYLLSASNDLGWLAIPDWPSVGSSDVPSPSPGLETIYQDSPTRGSGSLQIPLGPKRESPDPEPAILYLQERKEAPELC